MSNPHYRKKFSDKARFPNGQIVPQNEEEYYCRNFGAWFQKATKKFYMRMKLDLMKREDIPKYAKTISEFQKRDKAIRELLFTAYDHEKEEEWKKIVDRCCKDKIMANLYKNFGIPSDNDSWDNNDTRHGVEEQSHFFVQEHYSLGSKLDS